MKKKKILFVCAADVATTQNFIDLVGQSEEYKIKVFNSSRKEPHPPQYWKYPTISLTGSGNKKNGFRRFLGLPNILLIRYALNRLQNRFGLISIFLWLTIKLWRPHIVHSIALNPEAWITYRALKPVSKKRRPRWMVTSWSSDIFWDRYRELENPRILKVLEECDGLLTDCVRDQGVAEELGLAPEKVPVRRAIPGGGGIDESLIGDFTIENKLKENIILVPKGYDSVWHKPHVFLEALRLVHEQGRNFRAIIMGAPEDTRIFCGFYTKSLREKLEFHDFLLQEEYFSYLRRARIVLAPSLTDGTPNALLEAMALGALPVFSPHGGIREWVQDGENGFLSNPIDMLEMSEKIIRALDDEDFYRAALGKNQEIIRSRAARGVVVKDALLAYERILKP